VQLLSGVPSLFLKGVVIFPVARVIGGGIRIYRLDK
jgi:hypothetical protein